MDLEREKGITIKARAVRLEHTARDGLRYGLNLIDTPGHVDFSYEVSRSLQACEGAVLVVDAAQGIEAQTLANVYLALAQGLVIIPVINKIDLPSAQPDVVIEELENVLAIPREEVILVSAKDGTNVEAVLEAIVAAGAAAQGRPGAHAPGPHLRLALRRLQGRRRLRPPRAGHAPAPANRIRLMASGAESELLELGVFRPAAGARGRARPRRGGLRGHRPQVGARLPGRRHADLSATDRRPSRCPATSRPRRSSSPASTRSTGRTTRSCATPSRSCTSTTPPSASSPNRRWPSASASAAASSACCTWRSSRSAWSASSTSTSSPPRRRSSTS